MESVHQRLQNALISPGYINIGAVKTLLKAVL